MKRLQAALLPLILSACATSANPAEIEALVAAHDAAWNAHDPDDLAALFVEDATLVTPTGARVEGNAALRQMFASPGPTKSTTSTTTIEAVQWLDDNLALVDARQSLDGPGVEMLGASQARAVLVVRKDAGQWKIVAARPFVQRGR